MEYPDVEIDKTRRPIPEARGRPVHYPFKDMDDGDSFFVPGKTSSQLGSIVAYYNKKLTPARFVCRMYDGKGNRETKHGKVGCRVFRIE